MADASPSRRRSRSASPSRRPPKASRGFRWKETRPSDSNDRHDSRHETGRDARDRRDYRDRDRERSRERDRNDRHDRHDRYDRYDRRDRYDRNDRHSRRDDRPRSRSRSPRRRDGPSSREKGEISRSSKRDDEQPPKRKKSSLPSSASKTAPASVGQEFIVVNVNDRLGTKTAIPCLPSDTIAQFKLMLAARIGREPGQIMLRRQGERPFKDPLTLEDYGISNGVQLDLEIDTGD